MAQKLVGRDYSYVVASPSLTIASGSTGIITVTTAGTEVTGPDVDSPNGFMVIGHPDNTDVCWVMPVGVAKTSGYPISTTLPVILGGANLSEYDFDADVNGEKICYIMV